jgi:gentisate 1,2-dioxygenase
MIVLEGQVADRVCVDAFPEIRAAMIEAGGLITAKEAERRVPILENPGLRGRSRITTDLYAGVQPYRHGLKALQLFREDRHDA